MRLLKAIGAALLVWTVIAIVAGVFLWLVSSYGVEALVVLVLLFGFALTARSAYDYFE